MHNTCRETSDILSVAISARSAPVYTIMYHFVFVSIIQNLYAPDEDPEMKVLEYERTFEQNDELGINDIKTEDY